MTSPTTPSISRSSSLAIKSAPLRIKRKSPATAGPRCLSTSALRQRPSDLAGSSDGPDVRCLKSLLTRCDVEADALTFLQRLEARLLNCREVREEVLATFSGCDKAEAFGLVEPLDGACCHV